MEQGLMTINTNELQGSLHFIEYFLRLKANKSVHTSKSYERDIKDFFQVENVTQVTLEEIRAVSILDVEQYIMKSGEKGLASATINRKISALSALYKWLLRFQDNASGVKIIQFNPFGNVKEERPVINHKETEFLTKEECKQLLDSIGISTLAGLRNKTILALAFTTALRKSEIISIKLKDISVYNGYNVIKVKRKGGKEDIVKIQPHIRKMIEQYIQATGRNLESQGDAYLFIGHSTNGQNKERLDPSTLNYMLKKVCEKAGIKKKLRVHSTRHTAITLAITAGATIEKVRDFAAHRNLATTNRYVHSIEKLKNNAGDLIDIF